jgi:DNA polymerase III subunit gamma/tau
LVSEGRDVRTVLDEMISTLRDMFLSLQAPELVRLPQRVAERVADQGQRLGAATTVRALEVLGELGIELRHAPDPRLLVDVALVRLTRKDLDQSVAALVQRIEVLERAVSAGGPLPVISSDSAPSAPASSGAGPAAARAALAARSDATTTPPSRPAPRTAASTVSARPAPTPAPPPVIAADEPRRAVPDTVEPELTVAAPERPSAAPVPTAVPTSIETPTPEPARAAALSASSGALTMQHLDAAWDQAVSPKLKPLTRALFKAGRLESLAGTQVRYALPSSIHRDKCEPHRAEVESMLRAQLGVDITLQLVVAGAAPAPAPSAAPKPSAVVDHDEVIDMDDLTDAPPATYLSPLDRLTQAFPGAQVIDE